MPISSPSGKDETAEWIKTVKHDYILDVGVGQGTYADLIKKHKIKTKILDGIEAWKPYFDEFSLNKKYGAVFNLDVREWHHWDYDIVIFGDVLEHMSKKDAVKIWNECSKQARYAVISIPIVHSPQGHVHGNPFEEHVKDDWTALEVLNTFSHIYKHEQYYNGGIGVFFADFSLEW